MRHDILQNVTGEIQKAIEQELENWEKGNKIQRLWEGDTSLWTNGDESQWLGWLEEAVKELSDVARIEKLTNEIKADHYEHLVVLGMGGSSLCPAMLAKTFGRIENYPQLHVLDSTDPQQIRHLEDNLDLKKTLFIVSSKSGSTLEPNIFKQYFYTRLQTVLGKSEVGDRFVAITDPGSKLEVMAKHDQFRAIFQGVPSIGGRYSALSNFGMVPAGLMGVSVRDFLSYAEQMARACSPDVAPQDNPGVLLGVILGVCQRQGKDKVTLIASPGIHDLGAWLEQLLAESTGKEGKGLIPIDQEPLGRPENYGTDRLFVYSRLEDAADAAQDLAVAALEQAGHFVVRLNLANKHQLGAELFRWEMATAVAGSIIGINPFNQPDVEESKVLAVKLLTEYQHTGKLEVPNFICSSDELTIFMDDRNQAEIRDLLSKDLSPDQQEPGQELSVESVLQAHFSRIKPGDYVNLSAFIEMSDAHTELLQQCRTLIRDEKKIATCFGFGPRFLHSTGQDYKGGPNTGVFLQITAEHAMDLPIPGLDYTFGLVIDAQAEGDFNTLVKRKRRVLRVHLGKNVAQGLQALYKYIKSALQSNKTMKIKQ
jgi:glucose-6-phosphate isomerase